MWLRKSKNHDKREKVAVLFGGRSAEHEISVLTALQAMAAMDPERYQVIPVYIDPKGHWYTGDALFNKDLYRKFSAKGLKQVTLLPDPTVGGLTVISSGDVLPVDVYFVAFHGQYGEDGCIQGMLELAGACYTGSTVLGSSIAMNKHVSKQLAKVNGISTLPWAYVTRDETFDKFASISERIFATPGLSGFPLFVKPCHLGSSVGVTAVWDDMGLNAALANVFKYDVAAIIEPCLQDLLEVNVAVLEGQPPQVSVVEVPVAKDNILTYEDKYMNGGSKESGGNGMASLTRVVDPQDLDPNIKKKVEECSGQLFGALRLGGVVRFDFLVDTHTDMVFFNEVNPLPGSFAFYLWEKTSPTVLYTDLLETLIEQAKKRKRNDASVERHIGFKALATTSA